MLYVVGTPIGNIKDLSYRQGKTLADADIILTEDTRSTGKLMIHIRDLFDFDINPNQKLISYYKEREFEKLPMVLDILKEEKSVCLISQAGMPLISDPGSLLMKRVIKEHIPYTVIPGPTAISTSLIHAGYSEDQFIFLGFFPKKENDVKKIIQKMISTKKVWKECVFVAYESPHRINRTLELFNQELPNATITVTRELTKKFEEVKRGKPSELVNEQFKGEITLVIQ